MVGYVTAYKPEMKVKEYELYSSYYCGVCKSIGKRFGTIPRLVLSYDSAFMALLVSSMAGLTEKIEKQHCIVHPVNKKNICLDNCGIDYAADMMIILAYHKLIDDINDDKSVKAGCMEVLFRSTYRKLEKKYAKICECVKEELENLRKLEQEKSDSIDETSDTFGRMMRVVFSGCEEANLSDVQKLLLENLGYNLGKWIYIIDALDDVEDDIKNGSYNPLIYRFGYDREKETAEEFLERVNSHIEVLLFHYLGETGKVVDLIDFEKNAGIIDNIVYMGLHRKTEDVLRKGKTEDERSL